MVAALLFAASCATNGKRQPDTSIEEAFIYIQAAKPEPVAVLRYTKPMRYDYVNDQFVLMEEKAGTFLVQFRQVCESLTTDEITFDFVFQRSAQGLLRPKLDTIRGCLVEEIYKLPEPNDRPSEPDRDAGDEG